jgi:thioredoxin-like negative regulator of GroEL
MKAIPRGFFGFCGVAILVLGLFSSGCKKSYEPPKDIFDHNNALAIENNKAVLIYFHHEHDDVCVKQTPIVNALASELNGQVKVVQLDPLRPTQWSHSNAYAGHFHVHNYPTFILKKADEVYYFRRVGRLSADELKQWIANCMKRPATLADQSEQQ